MEHVKIWVSKLPSTPLLLIAQLRPKQWTKNLLVFSAFIFSIRTVDALMFWKVVGAFALFCLLSGCVYILNDYVDREADRNHPEKRNRPMASGALNPHTALSFGLLLAVACFGIAFYLNALFAVVMLLYWVLNIAYSLKLKHVVIVDIMIIAFGFVLRAIGGGLIIELTLTSWFLLCVLLISLFLAIGKRRHEVYLLQNKPGAHRKVLEFYSPEFLNQLNSIVTTATIFSYSLFTFTSGHSDHLMWTIPIVLYGIFRYLYLIHMHQAGGSPEKVLLEDKHILTSVVLYGITTMTILFYFG